METKRWPSLQITPERISALDGKSVLVKPAHSHESPVTAVRGSIRVISKTDSAHGRGVELTIDYPEMFSAVPRRRVIALDDTQLEQLLASENGGAFEFTYEGLNPTEAP